MKTFISKNYLFLSSSVIAVLATVWVHQHFFFFDTVQLASKHAHFFFENRFTSLLLPENMDSGHPPFFGMYIALCWSLFGKTLTVSHFAMLPFILLFLWQLQLLVQILFSDNNKPWAFFLLLVQPTLLSQFILVSPDVVLITGFMLLLNGVLTHKSLLKFLGVIILAMVSMRGWMVAFIFFIWETITNKHYRSVNTLMIGLKPYLPGGLLAISFLIFHYLKVGWIGYHEDSPWAPAFERVDLSGFMRNIAIYAWRLADFGMVVIWLGLVAAIILLVKNKQLNEKSKQLILLLGLFVIILPSSMLQRQSLLAHRYLLPVSLLAVLVFTYFLFENIAYKKPQLPKIIAGIAALSLLIGNCWIYPDTVAQGWDASLAHVPYYKLRNQGIAFIKEQNIPVEKCGSFFPNLGSFQLIDLVADTTHFAKPDLTKNDYFFYSNIYNDISDEQYNELTQQWKKMTQFEEKGINVIVFQKSLNQ